MASIISAGTTSGTSLNLSGDTSGVLQLATNGSTTAVTITTAQNVGIGTASPTNALHVNSNGEQINLTNPSSTGNAQIKFTGNRTYQVGTGNASSGFTNLLYFYDATAAATRMVIDSSGNVGIGTNSPSYPLHVSGSSGDTAIYLTATGTNNSGQFIANGNGAGSYPAYNLYQSGVNYWSVMMRADTNLYFQRQGGSGNTILTDGTFKTPSTISVGNATPSTSGAGITFPATQSASSNANTLDDYEEGTWTPVASSQTGSITSYTSNGTYTKVGNTVVLRGEVGLTNSGTAGGYLQLTGLPFTTENAQRPFVAMARENNVTGDAYICYAEANGTTMQITAFTNVGPINWTNGRGYVFSATYRTA